MKILVIMLNWYPYCGPLMPIYGVIFKQLLSMGDEITIVTSLPHHHKGSPESYAKNPFRLYEITRWDRAKLIRSWVFAPRFEDEKLSLLARALNFISFNVSSAIAAVLLGGKADVIFAPSSPPLTNGIVAYLVSRFKNCPFVYNVQDIYPDIAVNLGLVRNRLFLLLLKSLEKAVYRLANKVLTISGGMREIIEKKGVPSEKVEVIENFLDPSFFRDERSDNDFSRSFGLHDSFVVMYAGNIGVPHGVEVIVQAAEILRNEPGLKFCFVARGERRAEVERLTRTKGLKNVMFLPPQPESSVPQIWATASVGVISYRRGLAGFSLPSKLFAAMCAARPVIASVDGESETARIIASAKCGMCVQPESPGEIAEAILNLKKSPEIAREMGRNGREYVQEHLRKEVIALHYASLFKGLAATHTTPSPLAGKPFKMLP
jgi:colanic acid biosynthesis glycosyl transferase WcaI